MPKVLIVEDHPLFAMGLTSILSECMTSGEVRIAASGKESETRLKETSYDLVLLDIKLPDSNGIDLCQQIHCRYPKLKIIAVTSSNDLSNVNRMLMNGASGYIVKNAFPEEIIKGIKTVMNGKTYLCDEVNLAMKREEGHMFLTKRESEMLKLITEGYTSREISEKLFLGSETVKSYRKNLLLKLDVKNTAALVKKALDQKLV